MRKLPNRRGSGALRLWCSSSEQRYVDECDPWTLLTALHLFKMEGVLVFWTAIFLSSLALSIYRMALCCRLSYLTVALN